MNVYEEYKAKLRTPQEAVKMVKSGDLLVDLEVSITDEEVAQLEQNLELAQRNLAEVENDA